MRIDWTLLFTIFLAVILAELVSRTIFTRSSNTEGTQVSAEVNSPAQPVIVYKNPIEEFIRIHYPNAS